MDQLEKANLVMSKKVAILVTFKAKKVRNISFLRLA